MRLDLKSRSSGSRNFEPGSVIEMGDRGSGPAMTESRSAASRTVRAIGPSTDRVFQASIDGQVGTRPGDGLNPTTLQKLAGLRSEPPRSLPSASAVMPQASDTAAPPLLPPQVLERS